MSILKPILFLLLLSIFSCSNETYEESGDPNMDVTDPDSTPLNFVPNTQGDYWVYNVESSNNDIPEMNFTGTDSLYIATSTTDEFTYEANNGMAALGTMTTLLTNGSLSKTTTTLEYTGTLEFPIETISISEMPTINDLKIIDLDASNGEILSSFSENFSESIEIQGTNIPIEVSYALTSKKENFYATTSLNGMTYTNVFEATIRFNLSVTGTVTVFGASQSINFIQPQDILTVRYFYSGDVGLVRAESTQGFELSPELILLIQQLGETNMTTSAQTVSVEELTRFLVF
jgi:hypothetical protein